MGYIYVLLYQNIVGKGVVQIYIYILITLVYASPPSVRALSSHGPSMKAVSVASSRSMKALYRVYMLVICVICIYIYIYITVPEYSR